MSGYITGKILYKCPECLNVDFVKDIFIVDSKSDWHLKTTDKSMSVCVFEGHYQDVELFAYIQPIQVKEGKDD